MKITAQSSVLGNEISYDFNIPSEMTEAFLYWRPTGDIKEKFGDRYRQIEKYSESIEGVPQSVAIIPLLTNILPLAWLYGCDLHVPSIDSEFLSSASDLRGAYQRLYPELIFHETSISADRVTDLFVDEPTSPPLLLYSGGVDAQFSLFANIALNPTLVMVRGADVYFTPEDDKAWQLMDSSLNKTASALGVEKITIESSFKVSLAHWNLSKKFGTLVADNYWHAIQHGPALIGLLAPIAYKRGCKSIIISSSFSYKDPMRVRAGSHPALDESIRFFGCRIKHCDFTITRQEKLAHICKSQLEAANAIPLRVCWQTRTGKNCCLCEKCLRTIYGLYAENQDPVKFGFAITEEIEQAIATKIADPGFKLSVFWNEIIHKLKDCDLQGRNLVYALLRARDKN